MKKLLMLNGSHSEITMISEAKKLGYYVITTGNMPRQIGHTYADAYISADYSDRKSILKIAEDNHIDAVVSCANDFGAITAAYVAEKMGLPGHDTYKTAILLHQKDNFKKFAAELCLRSPLSDIYSNLDAAMEMKNLYEYPLIVKPVDLSGGKGISKVNCAEEYESAVSEALGKSRKGKIVVEKFIMGTYHSFSTFLVDQKVIGYFSDNEYSFLNPFFVASSGGPARNVEYVKDILIRQAEIIAEHLKLVNGVFHMQYVMDNRNQPYIIDICRRCSGDLYPEPIEHATGIPWAKWIVMAEAGYSSSSFTERGVQSRYCGRHCIMAEKNGTVEDVIISDEIKGNIYKKLFWWDKGYKIENYLVDKIGILFYEFSSEKEMVDKISRIKDLVKVRINDIDG